MEFKMNDNVSGQTNVVIVTGLSGAGKTHAADWFEDQGYYCIDNMPPLLIKDFLELADYNSSRISRAAFVVDIRSENFSEGLKSAISFMKQAPNISYKILFIEASDETLIKRYNESRRRHPLSSGGMATSDVIERERAMLDEVRRDADYIIDTTNMRTAEFQHEMDRVMGGGSPSNKKTKFSINIVSFGYKYGVPQDIDMAFDMRFIPNPFYVKSLKRLTGNNKKVQQYVMKQDITKKFIEQLDKMINDLIPFYQKEGKYHLNIGFGCTGGQHRSVSMANKMAEIFKSEGYRVNLEHRSLNR
jgi:UPF0042 nucleotide-binding protein